MTEEKEITIRMIVRSSVDTYAAVFADRHIAEYDDEEGVINMKIHNPFIAMLGDEVRFYSALSRSLDSSMGNMLEKMAMNIARLSYDVSTSIEGSLYLEQTEYIAAQLEAYKNTRGANHTKPSIMDYKGKMLVLQTGEVHSKRHESDYHLYDRDTDQHYLIELKIGGDLENQKSRSEKEALLEQYCILCNSLGQEKNVHLRFATAYNRYGEGKPWNQTRVKQFFANEELLISADFWNFICKDPNGYAIVLDEYAKNVHAISAALQRIKSTYLR